MMSHNYISINPTTRETLQTFPFISAVELEAALASAKQRAHLQRKTTYEKRAATLRNLSKVLLEKSDEFAHVMALELGKPVRDARAEIQKCASACDYYAKYGEHFLERSIRESDASLSYVQYQPRGVVLSIMPWNFPFWQVFRVVAAGIMAGNTFLIKPSDNATLCAHALESIFRSINEQDLLQIVLASHKQVSQLIQDERISMVTLTGSTAAGRNIAKQAGFALKPVVLELGGSDPFIVCKDADVKDAALTAAKARLINNGQSCIAAKRIIVHHDIFEEFCSYFTQHLADFHIGDPLEEKTFLGPLASKEQFSRIRKQIKQALHEGAKLLTPSEPLHFKGYFVRPAVFININPQMSIWREEVFGPVAPIMSFHENSEALEIANTSEFGLGASIWTSDEATASLFLNNLEAGTIFLNGFVKSDPRLPIGGIKCSGIGNELGREGILEHVYTQSLWTR